MRPLASVIVPATTVLMSVVVANTSEMRTAGTVYYINTDPVDPVALSNGTTVTVLSQIGIIRDDDPASPLNLSAHDCKGTIVDQGDRESGAGYCMATDKDGDVWWLSWTSDGRTGGNWQAIAGTGKYEGIEGSGTTTFVVGYPDRSVVSYDGSLTLK